MERSMRGRLVRGFACAVGLASSAVWVAPAHAQISNYWNEKFAQSTETPALRMQARLGSAVVAANGRVLAVGGSSLYEFAKNSAGQWTQTAKIVAPDAGVLTGPVVSDGSTLLIRGYTPAQTSVVYSYSHDGTKWRGVGILKGSAQFGTAIALDGCSALISSTREENAWVDEVNKATQAFVHHFDRCKTGAWTYVNSFSSPNDPKNSAYARFGASLSISGNNALVGEPSGGIYGRAYYYTKTGDVWSLRQTLEESGSPRHSSFGKTVAISNTLSLVAADFRNEDRGFDGMMVAFGTNGTTWTQLPPLNWYESYERFGYADLGRKIVITPNYVYVSAPGNWQYRYGAVYVFRRSGPTTLLQPYKVEPWIPLPPGAPPEAQGIYPDGHFGADFAVDGTNLFVGSPTRNVEFRPLLVNGLLAIYEVPPYTAPP